MKTIAVAIEGVLAAEPIPESFVTAGINQDGLWFVKLLSDASWLVMVTGSLNVAGVEHWLRSNGLSAAGVEFPMNGDLTAPLWQNRLAVYDRINRQNRGNLVVVDSSRLIRDAMVAHGAVVLQPWWPRHRAVVDEDNFVPIRPLPQFWNE